MQQSVKEKSEENTEELSIINEPKTKETKMPKRSENTIQVRKLNNSEVKEKLFAYQKLLFSLG